MSARVRLERPWPWGGRWEGDVGAGTATDRMAAARERPSDLRLADLARTVRRGARRYAHERLAPWLDLGGEA